MLNDIPTAIAREKRTKATDKYDAPIPESDIENDDPPPNQWCFGLQKLTNHNHTPPN
jgi:hypothetical protein